MKKFVLDFVNKFEGYKTAIKSLHWNSKNLSQHKLCDEIAEEIAEFQDTVSEVEQSIGGNLPYNKLKGVAYKITDVTSFLNDVIATTTKFYKKLQNKGDNYIGLRSECEAFLTKMQRFIYLINFTLKEEFKREYANKINEDKDFEEQIQSEEESGTSGLINDAIEALEMSDGMIEFDEWADAYQDVEHDILVDAWNQACEATGNEELKEAIYRIGNMIISGTNLKNSLQEAITRVVGRFVNNI